MQVSEVSHDDGKACAYLVQFLANGSWNIKGDDAEKLTLCKKWVGEVAIKMAQQLDPKVKLPEKAVPASDTMKVKGMGPLSKPAMKRKK